MALVSFSFDAFRVFETLPPMRQPYVNVGAGAAFHLPTPQVSVLPTLAVPRSLGF